jgi:hypothetical protein
LHPKSFFKKNTSELKDVINLWYSRQTIVLQALQKKVFSL